MNQNLQPNFTKASYFIFFGGGLGLIKWFFFPAIWIKENIGIIIFNLAFFIVLGILIRKGYSWIKYMLLAFSVLILINLLMTFNDQLLGLWSLNITTITGILQVITIFSATLLLFNTFKKN